MKAISSDGRVYSVSVIFLKCTELTWSYRLNTVPSLKSTTVLWYVAMWTIQQQASVICGSHLLHMLLNWPRARHPFELLNGDNTTVSCNTAVPPLQSPATAVPPLQSHHCSPCALFMPSCRIILSKCLGFSLTANIPTHSTLKGEGLLQPATACSVLSPLTHKWNGVGILSVAHKIEKDS